MSTSGDVQYIGGCSVHRRDTMSTSGGISRVHQGMFSSLADHDTCGGYHEYIGGCLVHRRIP